MGYDVECVELFFNLGDVDLESLRAAFRITPEANGEFERHGSMVLFVPQSPLAPDTVYEITVADNTVRTASGAVLAQGQRYAFRTNSALKSLGNYRCV